MFLISLKNEFFITDLRKLRINKYSTNLNITFRKCIFKSKYFLIILFQKKK